MVTGPTGDGTSGLDEFAIDIVDGKPELVRNENAKLLEHWLSLRGDRPAPLRSDFDPMSVPRLLPCILMLEPAEPGGALIRSFGSALATVAGRDFTGMYLSDLYAPHGVDRFRWLLGTMRTEHVIAVYYTQYRSGSGAPFTTENLWLPFLDESGNVSRVMGSTWAVEEYDEITFPPLIAKPHEAQESNQRTCYRV